MRATILILIALSGLWNVCPAGVSVDLDYANFRANDSLAYTEIYASIQRAHLIYDTVGASLQALFKLTLDVLQDSNRVLSDTFQALDSVSLSEPPTRGQFFPHVFRLIMKPGEYVVRGSLYQADVLRDRTSVPVTVRTFDEDSLALSDIELGARMEQAVDPSLFSKNGVLVLPNPTRFFGLDLPMFYYYAEAYGLDYDSARVDSYQVMHRVLYAENSNQVRPESRRTHKMPGPSVVIADGFPVSTLRTGTYELELTVSSPKSGRSAVVRKKFWIYRADDFEPGRLSQSPGAEYDSRLLASAPDVLNVIDPDSAAALMKYVLTRDQSKQVERLNSEGKRDFINTFWSQREQADPGAANRYFARVAEANSRWSLLKRRGWRSDRGRVFVMYGEPDLIDRRYAGLSDVDGEVWHYDRLEGGVIFVFLDRMGIGDLELVHSTKRGEIFNPDWESVSPNTRPREGFR